MRVGSAVPGGSGDGAVSGRKRERGDFTLNAVANTEEVGEGGRITRGENVDEDVSMLIGLALVVVESSTFVCVDPNTCFFSTVLVLC